MSDHEAAVRQAITKVTGAFADIGDPTDRAKAAGLMLESIPDLQRELGQIRQAAVNELRDGGLSLAKVGEALGVSRARAQQISEGRTANARTRRAARAEE